MLALDATTVRMQRGYWAERSPPFLERGELSPELFQLACRLRQLAPAALGALPELTSVDMRLEEVGRVAAGHLLAALSGEVPQ